jgi:hypothetical protein
MGTAVMHGHSCDDGTDHRNVAAAQGQDHRCVLSPHPLTGIFGGLGWLSFMCPPLGYRLLPYIAVLGLLGAVLLVLWLLVFGVNEQRWKEQASAAGNWRS